MSVMLAIAAVAALALSGDAQAQVATSPWTASDLNGGFAEISSANGTGYVLSASDQPITTPASNAVMGLEITFASTTPPPSNGLFFAAWSDQSSFATVGIPAAIFELTLDSNSFAAIGQNIAIAQTGETISVYRANLTEAAIGPAEYGNLIDTVEQNPNNVYALYGDGQDFNIVSNDDISGAVISVQDVNAGGEINFNIFEQEGLAIQASLSPIASVPLLGDVNLVVCQSLILG